MELSSGSSHISSTPAETDFLWKSIEFVDVPARDIYCKINTICCLHHFLQVARVDVQTRVIFPVTKSYSLKERFIC